jgi:isopropylmalate/homocitrate/citramalate synthase
MPELASLQDFDWNADLHPNSNLYEGKLPSLLTPSQINNTEILMEVRDALQGIRKRSYPNPEDVLEYLRIISKMGIQRAKVGIHTGKDTRISRITEEVLRGMYNANMPIVPCIASLARPDSVEWAIKMKEAHPALEVYTFISLSPSRHRIEKWDDKQVFRMLFESVDILYRAGIPVTGVAENASETPPEYLAGMIEGTVGSGASRICIPDTKSQLIPESTVRIIRYVQDVLRRQGHGNMAIEFHPHDDLGLAVANSMAAIAAGAKTLHVTPTGTGERAGNASDAAVLLQLHKQAEILEKRGQECPFPWEMRHLLASYERWHTMLNIQRRDHGPGGRNAFRSAAGVHTGPRYKSEVARRAALAAGDLAAAEEFERQRDSVYAPYDPDLIGGEASDDLNYMSSAASVRMHWTGLTGLHPDSMRQEDVDVVLYILKEENRPLTPVDYELYFNPANALPITN